MIEIHNKHISFSFKRLKDCLFSRRMGYIGIKLLNRYSLLIRIRL